MMSANPDDVLAAQAKAHILAGFSDVKRSAPADGESRSRREACRHPSSNKAL